MPGDDEQGVACPVCYAAASLRCSVCKEVSYCCKEHQKMDWKNHKNACKAYEIRTSKELGRYLTAARDLNPGDVIISETPLVWAAKSLMDPERIAPCVGCYIPVNVSIGERCASCGWPICSGHCPGLKDLKHHGLECLVLSLRPGCAISNMGDYYRHDALMALRCLLSQKKSHKRFRKIIELQSHIEDRGPDTEIYQEIDSFIVKYLQDNFLHPLRSVETELNTNLVPDMSSKLIHTLCGIIDVNSLDVILNNGSELSALYSTTCLMEHNCTPNTKHSFNTSSSDENLLYKITVKAALPIKKGENITTMYSHALWGTQARREHLKDTKYFSCRCERCQDPTELGTYLSAMKCLGSDKEPCGGNQLPENPCDENAEWICDKCFLKIKNTEISYLTSKLGEEVEFVQAGNPTIIQLEELLNKLYTFLHPNHYHVYSVKHSLVQLYGHQIGFLHQDISDELLEKKVNMCTELLDVTSKLDPGSTRLSLYSGVLHHELFHAKFEILKRKVKKNIVDKIDITSASLDLSEILGKAKKSLDDESDGSSGHKLTEVMIQTERNFIRWTTNNKVLI